MSQPETVGSEGQTFVGKRLLVGIRWTSKGEIVCEEQFHGLIVEADEDGLVVERADTGSRVILPPQIEAAPQGDYRLRGTGEVVSDPDYLASWRFDREELPKLPEVHKKWIANRL